MWLNMRVNLLHVASICLWSSGPWDSLSVLEPEDPIHLSVLRLMEVDHERSIFLTVSGATGGYYLTWRLMLLDPRV